MDEAAYVKAGFLSAIVSGDASSPIIDKSAAIKMLGNEFDNRGAIDNSGSLQVFHFGFFHPQNRECQAGRDGVL